MESGFIVLGILWFIVNVIIAFVYFLGCEALEYDGDIYNRLNLIGKIVVGFMFLPLILIILLIIGFIKSFKLLFFKRKKKNKNKKNKYKTVDDYNKKSMEVN